TTEVDVPAFLRRRPAFTDEQALELARLALALEAMAGRPVDIECAYRSGRLYLLQCRPITTLGGERPDVVRDFPRDAVPPPPAALPPRGIPIETPSDFPVTWQQPDDAQLLWTLDRVHWPDPLPTLVFSIAGDALAGVLTACAGRLWEIHFLLASPMHGAISQFGKLYGELFGGGALEAYRLLEGFDNKILQAGRALWHLSQLARALPEVRAIIENHPAAAIA